MFDPNEMPLAPIARKQEPAQVTPAQRATGQTTTGQPATGQSSFDPNTMQLATPAASGSTNQPKREVGLAEDIGRQFLGGLAQGAITSPGWPGSIERTLVKDVPEAVRNVTGLPMPNPLVDPLGMRNLAATAGEKLNLFTPEVAQKVRQYPFQSSPMEILREKGILSPESPEQAAGLRSPIFNLPTTKLKEEELMDMARRGLISNVGEVPASTEAGRISKEVGTSILPSAVGPFSGLGSRIVTGGSAAMAGKFAEEHFPDSAIAPIIATLGGGLAAEKLAAPLLVGFGRMIAPGAAARQDLYAAINRDLQNDPQRLRTLQDLLSSGEAGQPTDLRMADLLGPQSKALLKARGFSDESLEDMLTKTTNELISRAGQSPERSINFMRGAYGNLDAAGLTDLVTEAGKAERKRVYDYARSQASGTPVRLSDLDPTLVNRPVFKQAMDQTNIQAANMPQYGMQVPSPRTIVYPSGRTVTGASNLEYMDELKRQLDLIARTDPGQKTAALDAKAKLLATLDTMYPDYPVARGVASRTFQAESAPEAGLNFYRKTGQFDANEIRNALRQYQPEEADLFRRGFASGIADDLAKGGSSRLYRNLSENPVFRDKARLALGEQGYNDLVGHLAGENLLNSTVLPSLRSGPPGLASMAKSSGLGAGLTAGLTSGMDIISNMMAFSGDPALAKKAILGAVVGATAGAFKTAGERAIGRELVRLSLANTQGSREQLAKLLQQPSHKRVYDQMASVFTPRTVTGAQVVGQIADQYGPQYPDYEARQAQAKAGPYGQAGESINEGVRQLLGLPRFAGGRVGRASGGRISTTNHMAKAAALIRLAEKAKRDHSDQTESILNQPDAVVAKALAKANDAI